MSVLKRSSRSGRRSSADTYGRDWVSEADAQNRFSAPVNFEATRLRWRMVEQRLNDQVLCSTVRPQH